MTVSSPAQDSAKSLRAEQVQQVEELLFSEPARAGFAKALFRGEFRGKSIFPYPGASVPQSGRRSKRPKQPCARLPMNTLTQPRSTAMPTSPAR